MQNFASGAARKLKHHSTFRGGGFSPVGIQEELDGYLSGLLPDTLLGPYHTCLLPDFVFYVF